MAKEIVSKKERKELERALTKDEIEILEDLNQLYEKCKRLHKKEPFALTSLYEVEAHLVEIERAVFSRCIARSFPNYFKNDLERAKSKKNKKSKK